MYQARPLFVCAFSVGFRGQGTFQVLLPVFTWLPLESCQEAASSGRQFVALADIGVCRAGSRFFPIVAYSEILLADPASIERSSESQVNLHGVAWRLFLDLLVYRLMNCRVYAVSICKALAQELQALTRDASTGLFRALRFLCYYAALAVCSLFLCYYVALALCYLCCLLMFVDVYWRTKQFRQSRLRP